MSKAETLFDALQMAVHSKGSPYAYMTSVLRRARCFVLDESMSSFLAVLATAAFHELTKGHNMQFVRDEDGSSGVAVSGSASEVAQVTKKICNVVEGLRVLAKAPHAVTWIEFDFGKRFERYMKAFSAYGEKAEEFNKNRRASFRLCGWLIEQCSDEVYSCVCVMGDGKEQIEITPYAYVWTTGATRPSISGGFQFASPEDSDQFENTHERIASRLAFGTPAAEGSCQFGPTPVSRLVPIEW